jgi:hypothetical protein
MRAEIIALGPALVRSGPEGRRGRPDGHAVHYCSALRFRGVCGHSQRRKVGYS